jgi:hypothetical protein
MFSKFEYDGKLNPTFAEGPFELPFSSIRAYINEPITPRFVYLVVFWRRHQFNNRTNIAT